MDQLDHLGWVVQHAYEVGDVRFGVRTNSTACAAWLDDVVGTYRVDDDEVRPYYSVLLADGSDDDQTKRYHIVYAESRALVRTLDLGLVADCLLAQFEHVAAFDRDDAAYVNSGLVMLGDAVGLLPPILPPYLATLGHRKLARSGLDLHVSPFVAVDLETGAVMPLTSALEAPKDAAARLADVAGGNGHRDLRGTVTEPMKVDVTCFIAFVDEQVREVPAGRAAHLLSTRIDNLHRVGGAGIEAVAKLAAGATSYDISADTPKDALASVIAALQTA